MEPLSSSLIHQPAPWNDAIAQLLHKEAQNCFSEDDNPTTLISLISVGGIECQDLPMSGILRETAILKASPHLRYLLTCITLPLGRVCLYKHADTEIFNSPFYQNSAHPLFYQTLRFPLDENISLIVEIKGNRLLESDLYDTDRLKTIKSEATQATAKQTLKLAEPQLDILQPIQIKSYLDTILTVSEKHLTPEKYQSTQQAHHRFIERWKSLHSVFNNSYDGEWSYHSALNTFRQSILSPMRSLLREMVDTDRQSVESMLLIIDSQLQMFPIPPQRINRKLLLKAKRRKQIDSTHIDESKVFDRPIFIVSAPRAGSTLLFETLTKFPQIWSTGEENHDLLEDIQGLHPKDHHFKSNRLDKHDTNDRVTAAVKKAFISKLHDREQHYYQELAEHNRPDSIRFLEKTPKNALRIPFLKALFPDALFIYLKRDYKSNVSSLIDGWRSHKFIAYKNMPDFEDRHWKFLLIPEWQTLHNRSIAEIAHQQWQQSNLTIQQDLAELPNNCWMSIDYQDLILQPEKIARQVSDFAVLEWDEVIQARCENGLPISRLTLSSPQANKWEKHQCFLEELNANLSSKKPIKKAGAKAPAKLHYIKLPITKPQKKPSGFTS